MMKKFLLCCALLMALSALLSATTHAEEKTNTKTGLIPLYNPNGGGILASISLKVLTEVHNIGSNGPVNMSVQTSTSNSSFTQCGGSIDTVSPAKFGGNNVPLYTDTSDFIGDANRTYDRKKSNNHAFAKDTYTVTTKGQFYPTPNMCMG